MSTIIAEERKTISEVTVSADAYFLKLENALKKANDLARQNNEKHEAEYQADHYAWERERDNFPNLHAEWEREVEIKRKELAAWESENASALAVWRAEMESYSAAKKRWERNLVKLEDEKYSIDGFMAGVRRAKINKEIMAIKIELSRLPVPKEPVFPKSPEFPVEPVLRVEPVRRAFEEMIEKETVLDVFNSYMT